MLMEVGGISPNAGSEGRREMLGERFTGHVACLDHSKGGQRTS